MAEPRTRAEELRLTRNYMRRHLRPLSVQLNRLLGHLEHMEDGDLDRIHALLERDGAKEFMKMLRGEMLGIHSDEQCLQDQDGDNRGASGTQQKASFWESVKDAFSQPRES